MNNPYILSAIGGLSVYITAFVIHNIGSKDKTFNKTDAIKISLFVIILIFLSLTVYEKSPNPVLKEPFISSFES